MTDQGKPERFVNLFRDSSCDIGCHQSRIKTSQKGLSVYSGTAGMVCLFRGSFCVSAAKLTSPELFKKKTKTKESVTEKQSVEKDHFQNLHE